ncbi:hypothetical protein A3F58_00790 [Candidatus Roizmanbacteria bacterium RIFCSPHIGHO2_12_FULL_37_9b]|uniref:DUF2130 domain-containing protein n=1 Tax=Candidatus Roizmanbacteria bacterium RIFCSPHIGHO2_02_FULL_38_11 TaxID=1802039 RepID=A0A1F7GYN2_9BACT|nr:MAG: hypothetical protein A3C25_00835 [Candidatus Roizmanbacteria bacterium RIFCSPHIGHO2_02_FULL_38_11]OGK33479.1 MAG: hypothetical protein A3F58_00790 [Candidatus Roizmanbacteria bacterium RIFCSPHIGHO2_12_FULL_37_9b]
MNDQIICPNCKKPIPLTEALSHQIQEKYQKAYRQRFEDEKIKLETNLRTQLSKKIKEEMEFQMKDKSEEIGELRKQNRTLQDQLLELNRLMRQLKTENEQRNIEFEKKLSNEQEKIRLAEQKRIDQEYKFKILEYQKKEEAALKLAEDYKRKLEQGSQQLQGDVLEIELKNNLKREFPYDEIKDVSTGVRGADVLQIVKNNFGKSCGTIIWELKRTKAWSDGWINKLKEDQRRIKAEIAVIISQTLPDGVKHFTQKDGVWIGDYESITGLGLLLRNTLLELSKVKSSVVGKQEKKEILWNYLTSTEFRHRLEAIYDTYQQEKVYLDKEKEFFRRKWAREEKNIQLLMENLLGMHGDLQAIIGRSLPEMKGLEMLPSGKEEKNDTLF